MHEDPNPYRVNESVKPSDPIEPMTVEDVRDWIVILLFLALAGYGLNSLLYDVGIIVHDASGHPEYWFEEELRRWIRGR